MSQEEVYEVYAIRYARIEQRFRHQNILMADPHDGLMPIDFYVWALISPTRTVVVDTGFNHEEGQRRGRAITRLPAEGLAMVGVAAAEVKDVVITHLHFDHAGTLEDFPQARFHVQDREMAYGTGRHMCHQPFAYAYSADHVCAMVRHLFQGRVVFHDGDDLLAPGLSVHLIGGHTAGMQCVRVRTRRGWVVLASDASHFYENMENTAPFPIVLNVGEMVQGYAKLRQLADSPKHIIPGHDPLVMARYPAPAPEMEGVVVRLDVDPRD